MSGKIFAPAKTVTDCSAENVARGADQPQKNNHESGELHD
jgi:hypothetical protein